MHYRQLNDAARLLGASLTLDQSTLEVCPSCGGGSTGERSFSITRNREGLLYNCFRATCGVKGFVGTAAALVPPGKKSQKLREYWHPVLPAAPEDADYFYDRFGITSCAHINRSQFDEYIFPVRDLRGYTRGYVVRQPRWDGLPNPPIQGRKNDRHGNPVPKARTFSHVEQPMQSFYGDIGRSREHDYLVVVEDQVSAIKVAEQGLVSVALLGTEVNSDKVREWSGLRPQTVLIALDEDATEQAFKIVRKWGLAFPSVRVVMLEEDLKDTYADDIREVLGVEL